MERVRRRLWTAAVTVLAALVILAAAVSGLFQLAVLALPSYRVELAAWVTRVADRPVEIGGVNLVWHGIYPRLELTDITLFDDAGEEEALTAERLSLGFSGPRLLMGELLPTRIELSGLSLAADVDEQGHLSVAGFDSLGEQAFPRDDRIVRALSRFQRVRLRNCQVRFTHARLGRTPLQFKLLDADLGRTFDGFDAEVELQLPPAYGDRVELTASIDGEVGIPDTWDGEFELQLHALGLQPWLQRWLAVGTVLQARGLELRAEGELNEGRIAQLRLKGQADAVVAARAGRAHSAQALDVELAVVPDGESWRVEIAHLRQDEQELLRGGLRYRKQRGVSDYELEAELDAVQLAPFTAWLAYARHPAPQLKQLARLQGELDGLVLRLQRAGADLHYSVRADLKALALKGAGAVGFERLSGSLSATEDGGRLQLSGEPLVFSAPDVVPPPLNFDSLTGELSWTRAVDGWTLQAPAFAWALAGTRGSGRLRLELPSAPRQSPRLDLETRFSADSVDAVKPFMPLHWSPELRGWLSRALKGGRVPRAELRIRGALADFPYGDGKSGEWRLDLDSTGGRLIFAPDWPALDNVAAHLRFRGRALDIVADSASIGGNRIDKASARFADLHQGLLKVDASLHGETARFYELLRNTPLRKPLAGLVTRTRASGPVQVGLHLEIPVQRTADTTVNGEVALGGVQLFYENLDQPVDDIRGRLRFTTRSVEAERLDARFGDIKLAARIEPRPKTAGLIVAEFPFTPQASGGVNEFIPGFVRSRLAGEARWRAELPIDAPDAALVLSSDLRGTAVQFPPPLGKAAGEAAPIRVSLGSDSSAPLRVRVDYAQRLGADVALAREGQALKTQAIHLRLGGGMPAPAQGQGIAVSGELAELDFGLWAAALAGSSDNEGLSLREADVSAGRWLFGDQVIGAARMRWTPGAEGWRMDIDGAGAKGELRYTRAGGGALAGSLQQLRLTRRSTPSTTTAAASNDAPARDPNHWPTADISCERLVVDEVELGRVVLKSSRIADGQRLEALSADGGKLRLNASGAWRRAQNRSSGELKFEATSDDLAAALRALGYTPNISARSGRFTGELAWPGAPKLDWQQANGRVHLDVENGTLKAVEPGAGRVLGLFNLYAIPRRLALDFRDVVSSGLGFDRLEGGFTLGNGVATTSDLEIRSPSLRMEIRGRIGLVARDFDQTIKVYPDVSSGVTLGAALLGGPAVGALVLLAQQVLDKPLEQATQLSYRVTGSWDNPRVERGSGG